jgi:O-antigen/teichoic acid export membrane protein
LLVIHAQDKVTARILGLALVEVICYTGFFVVQMKEGKVFYSKKFWTYVILFNLPLIPHYLAGSILSSADRIMIKDMISDTAAGIYTLAYSVSQIMVLVNDSLYKTVSPYMYQRIREKDYGSISQVVYPSLILVALSNLLLISFAPEIIAIFAPPEYMEAIYVIPPVAMSVYVQFLYLCFAPFEFYFEKRSWTTIGTFVSAVLNLILNYIFIPLYGYQAAGYTTLVCYTISSLMHYYFMRKVCRTYLDDIRPYDPKVLFGISLGFFIAGFIYIPIYTAPALRYAVTAVLAVLIIINRNRLMPFVKKIRTYGKIHP